MESITNAKVAREHHLKTVEPHFGALYAGHKTFELRKDDRDFKVGDRLILHQYNAEKKHFCGPKVYTIISHILRDAPEFGLMPGYCLLSLKGAGASW